MSTRGKETPKRTSAYSSNRRNYLTNDGRYVYYRWDDELKREVPIYLSAGENGIDQEIIILLDSIDHDEDLLERYTDENADYSINNKRLKQIHAVNDENFDSDPLDEIEDVSADIFRQLFPDEESKDPRMEQLESFIKTLTPSQINLIYDHFGSMKTLVDICAEENAADGTDKSPQSVGNRLKKMLVRGCKEFGVEPATRKRNK